MTTNDIRRVGMIGLGKMGLPMARHLVGRGFAVTGYDISADALKAAASAGMQPVNSPKAVAAASELVIIVVGFDSEVEAVMFGETGVVAGASDGRSSRSPRPSRRRPCADRGAAAGVAQDHAARHPALPRRRPGADRRAPDHGRRRPCGVRRLPAGVRGVRQFDPSPRAGRLGPGRQDGQQPDPVGLHLGQRGRLQARATSSASSARRCAPRCSIPAPATGRWRRGRRRSRCRGPRRT